VDCNGTVANRKNYNSFKSWV